MITKISDKYFETLGEPKPIAGFPSAIDKYRFYFIAKLVIGNSVLDIGAYFGDFLKVYALINPHAELLATDINEKRVAIIDRSLNRNVARVDFKNGELKTFQNKCVDTIVCTEVLEHVYDNEFAMTELMRVARKRIIITVPFNEKIQQHLCLHCNQYTPPSGHLHEYQLNSFDKYQNDRWKISCVNTFGNRVFNNMINKTGHRYIALSVDAVLKRILPSKNRWLLIILDNAESIR
ncbi:MAG: class I SAM-dependent methyltransferase [Patescibacteria group bacterium]